MFQATAPQQESARSFRLTTHLNLASKPVVHVYIYIYDVYVYILTTSYFTRVIDLSFNCIYRRISASHGKLVIELYLSYLPTHLLSFILFTAVMHLVGV